MTSLSATLGDPTSLLAAKMEALSMRMSNLENLFLPSADNSASAHPLALLSTMNKSLSECLNLIDKTENELRDEIDQTKNEVRAIIDSKFKNTHAALSDTIARIDSLEMARSGDMERWGKAMEDVDQLKRSEELQIEKKTEELGKQITELQRDNEKLRDEVKALSYTCKSLDKRFASKSSVEKIKGRVDLIDSIARKSDQFESSIESVHAQVSELSSRLSETERNNKNEAESVRTNLAAMQSSISTDLNALQLRFEEFHSSRHHPVFSEQPQFDNESLGAEALPGVASLQKMSLAVKKITRGHQNENSHGN